MLSLIFGGGSVLIVIEFGMPTKLVRGIKKCLDAIYNRVRMDKSLCDMFLTKRNPIKGDALSPWLFNLTLLYGVSS
jgi:hypothetical protein